MSSTGDGPLTVNGEREQGRRGRDRPRRPAQRIGIRELRQHASIYVDLAEKGYTVDITNRGRLVARLVPVANPASPLERLIAQGVLSEPEEPGDLLDIEPAPAVPPGEPTLSDVLLRMRGEERY